MSGMRFSLVWAGSTTVTVKASLVVVRWTPSRSGTLTVDGHRRTYDSRPMPLAASSRTVRR